MAGKKYMARGKTVQKMSKEGVTEENLHDHTKKLVHHSEPELPRIRSPEFQLEREKNSSKLDMSEGETSKRNKKYQLQRNVEQEAEPQEGEAFFRGEQEPTRKRQRRKKADMEWEREENEVEAPLHAYVLYGWSLCMNIPTGYPNQRKKNLLTGNKTVRRSKYRIEEGCMKDW